MTGTSAELNSLIQNPVRGIQPEGFVPSFADLIRVYRTYISGQDLREGKLFKNECAVRMSIALSVNGFSFERFGDQRRVINGGRSGIPVPHVYGARELAEYLRVEWSAPMIFDGNSRLTAEARLQEKGSKKGVIYFANMSGPGRSHIDLFDGECFYNQRLGIAAHAGVSNRRSYYYRSASVWFWQLR